MSHDRDPEEDDTSEWSTAASKGSKRKKQGAGSGSGGETSGAAASVAAAAATVAAATAAATSQRHARTLERIDHWRYLTQFRTQLCKAHENLVCQLGDACFQAHDRKSIRRSAVNEEGVILYDKVMCEHPDHCRAGNACKKAHSKLEQNYHPIVFKVAPCHYKLDDAGHCATNGVHCSYAHGPSDHRAAGILGVVAVGVSPASAHGADGSGATSNIAYYTDNGSGGGGVRAVKPDGSFDLNNFRAVHCSRPRCHCDGWHTEEEQRRSPFTHNYSVQPCPSVYNSSQKDSKAKGVWGKPSQCPKGVECNYSHTKEEQMYHPDKYKTTPCTRYAQGDGTCHWGIRCSYSHGSLDTSPYTQLPVEAMHHQPQPQQPQQPQPYPSHPYPPLQSHQPSSNTNGYPTTALAKPLDTFSNRPPPLSSRLPTPASVSTGIRSAPGPPPGFAVARPLTATAALARPPASTANVARPTSYVGSLDPSALALPTSRVALLSALALDDDDDDDAIIAASTPWNVANLVTSSQTNGSSRTMLGGFLNGLPNSAINGSSGLDDALVTSNRMTIINQRDQGIEVAHNEVQMLKNKIQHYELCPLCKHRTRQLALIPCGHIVCNICGGKEEMCGVCHQVTSDVLFVSW